MIELNVKEKSRFLLFLSIIAIIGPLSISMYLPGLNAIAKDFNAPASVVGLSVTAYFLGLTIGHLSYGPFLDRFGRRKPLVAGLVLYTIAGISCAFSLNIEWLIISRLFFGIGGAAGVVFSRVVVRDYFGLEESAKVFSVLILTAGLTPIVAPFLGSLVLLYFGWRYIFLAPVLVMPLLFVIVYYFLPPLKKENVSVKIHIKEILKNYFTILKHPSFLSFGLSGGITYASLFTCISGSSFIYMKVFDLSEQQYGWAFAINAAALILGTQLNHWLLKKGSSKKVTETALIFLCAVITLLLAGTVFSIFALVEFMIFIFLFIFLIGILNPNTMALTLSPFGNEAGRASALLGGMQIGISTILSAIISSLPSDTAIPFLTCLCCCAFVSFLIVHLYSQSNK